MLLSPLEDLAVFLFSLCDVFVYRCKSYLGINPLDPFNAPMPSAELLRSYKRTYLGPNRKVFDPYFKYCLHDPVVSLLWWLKYSYQVLAATKHLGH